MGFDRRAFIQLITGGTVGILFTPVVWKLLDDVSIWTQNWPWIPTLKYGEKTDRPTVSKICNSGCAVNVRTVAGKAFGTEGNPENPLSRGGICPMCSNGVQLMRSPNRIKTPMVKGADGSHKAVSWDEAMDALTGKLQAAGSSVGFISGDLTGTANEVYSAFVKGAGSDDFFKLPGSNQAASRAWNGLMGGNGQIGYDLPNADLALLVGADAFESWGPTVWNQKAFSDARPMGEKPSCKYVFAGPSQQNTASVCDEWIPLAPEGEAAFMLGVAHSLLQTGMTADASDFNAFKTMVMKDFNPSKVEAAIKVPAASMASAAKQLRAASRPVVIPSGNSVAAHAAAFALNMLLGNLNRKGGMTTVAEFPLVVEGAMTPAETYEKDVVSWFAKGANPDVLITADCNPVYSLPVEVKAGFMVAIATEMNETAAAADLILPAAHPYERFDDLQTPYGVSSAVYTASVPVTDPAFDSMAPADIVLKLADAAGSGLGVESFSEVLMAKAEMIGAEWDDYFGVPSFETEAVAEQNGPSLAARTLAKAAAPVRGTGAVALAPYTMLTVGTDRQATTPNAPCVVSRNQIIGDTMVVMMNSATARKIGVGEGSKVKMAGGTGSAEALVHIYEGVLPGVVAAPFGFGHTVGDEFSKGKGDNVYKILTVTSEAATGASVWNGSTVNVTKL
jgi:anaerobic selenocysteine-containing dehydrogenase